MLSTGTPAAAMLIGLLNPINNTFIFVAETEREEAPTMYDPVVLKVLTSPFLSFNFTATLYSCCPTPLAVVVKVPTPFSTETGFPLTVIVGFTVERDQT